MYRKIGYSMTTMRTWIEINQDHFNHNISQYKKVIGNRNLSIVIKANAYGHSITHIAQLAEGNPDVHSFCVATIDEALSIRAIGAAKPILITSVLDGDPSSIINKNVSLAIYDAESARFLQSIGAKHNAIFPVHIKVDTGLSRLGIAPERARDYIRLIQSMPNLSIQGIYSHCAESNKAENSFTLQQRDLFQAVIEQLLKEGLQFPFIHFANSAATTSLDLPFCNLFRVGVGIFGLWPSLDNKLITQEKYPWFDLKPILTWKTTVRSIKEVSAGSFIGYDRTFQAKTNMCIAAIPVGYYDGYDFRLFNKASVIINGMHAPIVGRVSMNMSTIDVSHIPNIHIGNEAILMGPYSHIHPYELGLLAGNPNVREMTTKINASIARIITHTDATQKANLNAYDIQSISK